jgi:hypothetical protein
MKVEAIEYVKGTSPQLIAPIVQDPISPDVYYPTRQPYDHESFDEFMFKGYPVEEVMCWEEGHLEKKHLVIAGSFAYDVI